MEAPAVVALIRVRQAAELFGVVRRAAVRCHEAIRDGVVDVGVGRAAREADVGHLQRRWPVGEDARAAAAGVEFQINRMSRWSAASRAAALLIAQGVNRDVMLDGIQKALPVFGDIEVAVVVGEHFEPAPVVLFKHPRHEMHGRVLRKSHDR